MEKKLVKTMRIIYNFVSCVKWLDYLFKTTVYKHLVKFKKNAQMQCFQKSADSLPPLGNNW